MNKQNGATISGFSKLNKDEKIAWLMTHYPGLGAEAAGVLQSFWLKDAAVQRVLEGFSENTISNFHLPYGIAPNFRINDRIYAVPMVIEESSVVAAAASAAKFWLDRGGFRTQVLGTVKLGQLHFSWSGNADQLRALFPLLKQRLRADTAHLTRNMELRGGGILGIELVDLTDLEPALYQLRARFETCDSMGANFINTVLEEFGNILQAFLNTHPGIPPADRQVAIIMAILSNYTPECLVRAEVKCPVTALDNVCQEMDGATFAAKFQKAVRIARIDPYRATTHNKGIYNGVDAVVLATGNDFRAVEACGHTFAARDGQYRSLSDCRVADGEFHFWLDLPIALGTVGGLTSLHPLAGLSLAILGHPSASELMQVIAATGLAQNFAALRSLVTTGIQKGHMKMHLLNILQHIGASEEEARLAVDHFRDQVVSFSGVRDFVLDLRAKFPTA